MTYTPTRRRVLQGLAVGSAGALAGCTVGSPTNDVQVSQPLDLGVEEANLDAAKAVDADRVAADPRDVPKPIARSKPATVPVELETREVVAEIEPGVTFTYMTFDGQIPGPFIRTRVGDTVDLTIRNHESSAMAHNVDFHACRGPGGGAEATTVNPGEEKRLQFKVTYPGAFVYHCAVANVDYHISSGMFGLILVEPEDGLPAVDREFYLGQMEAYTTGKTGQEGHHEFDHGGMAAENPTYVLVNGEKYAIGPQGYDEMRVGTDERVRIYYAVGGPNLFSSFHAIGSVWDEVYPQGALASEPDRYVQTTPVLPGSAAVVTAHFPVPGDYKLVDHALSRVARKGALAVIRADGPANDAVFAPEER
ncbi:nitrite reductase, copper-containing [Halomicroarcula limicola]|uniref:Copper-containing nitrite reductase n=1 Tax=Haloarcula limicola TaxID=1429915 RepID=A0A8J8C949_9EURY|nr:copper-containing nitrite reductase [Halomicroarcula limicola]MBV0925150.1 nitrite reductase, copper-containing [Halomicroarcula limicola]